LRAASATSGTPSVPFSRAPLEPARGCQQEPDRLVAPAGDEGQLSAQQVDPRALRLVERSRRGRGQQPASRVERACLEARLSGGQCAPPPPRRVRRQGDGTLQEGGRGGDPPARLRAPR
jgi:hypothetical protein